MQLHGKIVLVLVVVLMVVPPGVYNDDAKRRLLCNPIRPISDQECKASLCELVPTPEGVPKTTGCYLVPSEHGYTAKQIKQNADGLEATLAIKQNTRKLTQLRDFVDELKLSVKYLTSKILRIRITDANAKRYEVPIQQYMNIPETISAEEHNKINYEANLAEGEFRLLVTRKDNDVEMIDTSLGPLLFTDKYLQFVSYLASDNLYGFGENNHHQLRHNLNYVTTPIFARDDPNAESSFGSHPFYMVVENDGKAHGVFLLNSNAMAYTTLPAPGIALKTTGGIFDLFVFVGENPEEVVHLYTSIIGRPMLPPFWSLGFHLSRYGFKNIDHVRQVVKRNLDNNVPFEALYLDIDYMEQFKDFTYDKNLFGGLPQYVLDTKQQNHLHWVLYLSPDIKADIIVYKPFEEGYHKNVFIKWPDSVPVVKRKNPANVLNDTNIIYGKVWFGGPVAFPDFLKNATKFWWKDMISEFYGQVQFDGLWLSINEPANSVNNFCPDDGLNVDFPNLKLANLATGTICMGSVQGEHGEYRHFDVHSIYGLSQTEATQKALHSVTGKRGFVMSRSTFATSGQFGSHLIENIHATFAELNRSIVSMIEFNLFGVNMVGANICGFYDKPTPDLCKRWYQLSAYYPFSRVHSSRDNSERDPAFWSTIGHAEVTTEMLKAYRVRYQLIHHWYTLFFRAHTRGETVIRSLFQEFSDVTELRDVQSQFLIGSSIMVTPFLQEKQISATAYLPPAHWYRFDNDFLAHVVGTNERYTFYDSESHRPLLLREGLILPIVTDMPEPLNTFEIRRKPIELWIIPTAKGKASGDLFWDDGESIDTFEKGQYNYFAIELDDCNLWILPLYHAIKDGKDGEVAKISIISIILAREHQLSVVEIKIGNATLSGVINRHQLSIPIGDHLDLYRLEHTVNISLKKEGKCYLD